MCSQNVQFTSKNFNQSKKEDNHFWNTEEAGFLFLWIFPERLICQQEISIHFIFNKRHLKDLLYLKAKSALYKSIIDNFIREVVFLIQQSSYLLKTCGYLPNISFAHKKAYKAFLFWTPQDTLTKYCYKNTYKHKVD